jgi:mandelate racemase
MMLEAMKIGGVTGWLRASALCAASGIRVSNHLWPEISAQLLSITPTAHWLEYCDWWNPVLADPLQIEDGMTVPSSAPGSGIMWNEAAISRL